MKSRLRVVKRYLKRDRLGILGAPLLEVESRSKKQSVPSGLGRGSPAVRPQRLRPTRRTSGASDVALVGDGALLPLGPWPPSARHHGVQSLHERSDERLSGVGYDLAGRFLQTAVWNSIFIPSRLRSGPPGVSALQPAPTIASRWPLQDAPVARPATDASSRTYFGAWPLPSSVDNGCGRSAAPSRRGEKRDHAG